VFLWKCEGVARHWSVVLHPGALQLVSVARYDGACSLHARVQPCRGGRQDQDL